MPQLQPQRRLELACVSSRSSDEWLPAHAGSHLGPLRLPHVVARPPSRKLLSERDSGGGIVPVERECRFQRTGPAEPRPAQERIGERSPVEKSLGEEDPAVDLAP